MPAGGRKVAGEERERDTQRGGREREHALQLLRGEVEHHGVLREDSKEKASQELKVEG